MQPLLILAATACFSSSWKTVDLATVPATAAPGAAPAGTPLPTVFEGTVEVPEDATVELWVAPSFGEHLGSIRAGSLEVNLQAGPGRPLLPIHDAQQRVVDEEDARGHLVVWSVGDDSYRVAAVRGDVLCTSGFVSGSDRTQAERICRELEARLPR